MPIAGSSQIIELLHSLSNPVRKGIIETLGERGQATFSDLLILCDLDIYYQKGLLDYHLKEMCRSGILAKTETGYVLTSIGRSVAKFLDALECEYQRLFTTKFPVKGGEIGKLDIATFEDGDAEEVSIAKYGDKDQMRDEVMWACGNTVPLKHMSEWGQTFSLVARSNRKVIGVLYGNTIPMHVISKDGKELGVIQPTEKKPANRLDGEIFEIWVHPSYEGQGVEKQLIKEFTDRVKKRGAVTVIAERVLSENATLVMAFEEMGFQRIASYQDFRVEI